MRSNYSKQVFAGIGLLILSSFMFQKNWLPEVKRQLALFETSRNGTLQSASLTLVKEFEFLNDRQQVRRIFLLVDQAAIGSEKHRERIVLLDEDYCVLSNLDLLKSMDYQSAALVSTTKIPILEIVRRGKQGERLVFAQQVMIENHQIIAVEEEQT